MEKLIILEITYKTLCEAQFHLLLPTIKIHLSIKFSDLFESNLIISITNVLFNIISDLHSKKNYD